MNRGELRADLVRRLEEITDSPVFFSEDDLNEALNEGYQEISDATEWNEVWRTVDILHTRPYYDLRAIFGDIEVLSPTRAFNTQTNRWLIPSSPGDMDAGYPRWEQVRAQPERILVRGLFWVGYWPILAAETGTIKQFAVAQPTPLEDDEDSPGFEAVYHEGLVEYALSVLLPQMGEVKKALAAWQAYLAIETELGQFQHDRGGVPQNTSFQKVFGR